MIFEYKTSFQYLQRRLRPRGIKTRFAHALKIQPAFLSQVLKEKYALSLEQADLANQFFDHATDEAEFFLLLISKDRAGTLSLQKHFDRQIALVLQRRQQVVERLGKKLEITDEAKGVYYSSWLYAATHVACTIPTLRTRKNIASALNMPTSKIGEVLDFLEANNLLQKDGENYLPTQNWIRLDRQSPHIVKHHSNWRQRAIQNMETQVEEDLHYSGVFSLDRKTALRIKDQFLDFLKTQLKDIEVAKEEELFVLGVDFFSLVKR